MLEVNIFSSRMYVMVFDFRLLSSILHQNFSALSKMKTCIKKLDEYIFGNLNVTKLQNYNTNLKNKHKIRVVKYYKHYHNFITR